MEQIIIPIIFSSIISLLVYIFKDKSDETKDRIDARQEEIRTTQEHLNNFRERIAILEKDSQTKDQILIELRNSLKEQKAEFQKQFSHLDAQLKEILKELINKNRA